MIRRRLGTVGKSSPLHNIRKVMEGAVKVSSFSLVQALCDLTRKNLLFHLCKLCVIQQERIL